MSKKLWQSKPTNYIKINIKKKKKNQLPTLDIDKKSWWEFWIYEKKKRQAKESTEDIHNQLLMHSTIGTNIIPLKTFKGNNF